MASQCPITALAAVERGDVSLERLLDLNSLLDMNAATQEQQADDAREEAENKARRR